MVADEPPVPGAARCLRPRIELHDPRRIRMVGGGDLVAVVTVHGSGRAGARLRRAVIAHLLLGSCLPGAAPSSLVQRRVMQSTDRRCAYMSLQPRGGGGPPRGRRNCRGERKLYSLPPRIACPAASPTYLGMGSGPGTSGEGGGPGEVTGGL